MLTKEQRKEIGIKRLSELNCYKPYLNAYKKGTITMYEGFGGYYLDSHEQAVLDKIESLEQQDLTTYAVIHNMTNFGELYNFLVVSKYEEDENQPLEEYDGYGHSVFAMVWNKDGDFTEGGEIGVKEQLGGLVRTF